MSNGNEIIVRPSLLRELLSKGELLGIGDDFIIARRHDVSDYNHLEYPFRIDSYLAAFCFSGGIKVSINLSEYELEAGMLLIATPGNIIRLSPIDPSHPEGIFTVINVSQEYFRSAGFDLRNIFLEATKVLQSPCIMLNSEEIKLLGKYVDIVSEIISHGSRRYINESVSSVISSVFYQFAGFLHNTSGKQAASANRNSSRRNIMFEEFMKLVAEHHSEEHQMAFYADKLCVTPKYLSKIIRDLSGRSGPEWIDEFIILSAKNMLRHSDVPICDISEWLNFKNQSFFFRFFKNHTGMTPNQYRQE